MAEIEVRGDGWLSFQGWRCRCALGRAGIVADKREGDGGTPAGQFPLRRLFYRPDRLAAPSTGLPTEALTPASGWCDAPGDANYNRPVRLPYPASAERLWRDDRLYDLIVVLGHNDAPVVDGRGSAVFLHLARADWGPTEGCVAVALPDLVEILTHVTPATSLRVRA